LNHVYHPGDKKPLAILFIFSSYFIVYELAAYFGAGRSIKYTNILTIAKIIVLTFYSLIAIISMKTRWNN